MKSITIALAIAVAAITAGAVYLVWRGGPPEEPAGAREAVQELGVRIEGLSKEIARLSGRIEALEHGDGEHGAAAPVEAAPPGTAGQETARTPADGGTASAEPGVDAARKDLAAATADPAKADRLRDFVAQVIRQEREDRQRRQNDEARARMEEFKALNEGPYGKYNYKINSLARKLGLSEAQKQYFHGLLQEQEPRLRELQKDVKWNEEESRQAYLQNLDQLQKHFENMAKNTLSAQQREEFDALPPHERGMDGGSRVIISTGEGGTDFISSMPLPPIGADMDGTFEIAGPAEGGGPSLQGSVETIPAGGAAVRVFVGGPIGGGEAASPPQEAAEKKAPAPEKPAVEPAKP